MKIEGRIMVVILIQPGEQMLLMTLLMKPLPKIKRGPYSWVKGRTNHFYYCTILNFS